MSSCCCEGKGSEALKVALSTENDGLEMYEKAAENTAHPFGKKMFLSLAEDEKTHIRMIEQIAEGLGMTEALKDAREGTPRERVKTVFSEVKDEIGQRIAASTDDIEALRIAMEFEKKGYEFYEKAADEACDENEKGLFGKLAKEENEHYSVLQNTLQYLEGSGLWFCWEEQSVLDGG